MKISSEVSILNIFKKTPALVLDSLIKGSLVSGL